MLLRETQRGQSPINCVFCLGVAHICSGTVAVTQHTEEDAESVGQLLHALVGWGALQAYINRHEPERTQGTHALIPAQFVQSVVVPRLAELLTYAEVSVLICRHMHTHAFRPISIGMSLSVHKAHMRSFLRDLYRVLLFPVSPSC